MLFLVVLGVLKTLSTKKIFNQNNFCIDKGNKYSNIKAYYINLKMILYT